MEAASSVAQNMRAGGLHQRPQREVSFEADGDFKFSDEGSPGMGFDDKTYRTVRSKRGISNDARGDYGPRLSQTFRDDEVVEHSVATRRGLGRIDDPFNNLQPPSLPKLIWCTLPVTTNDPRATQSGDHCRNTLE